MIFRQSLRRDLNSVAGVMFATLFTILVTTSLIRFLNKVQEYIADAVEKGGALMTRASHVIQWSVQRVAKPRGGANLTKPIVVRIALCNSSA